MTINLEIYNGLEIPDGIAVAIQDTNEVCMQKMIEEKKQLFSENFRRVREKQKQNKFLTGVVEDYIKYYKYIAKQKREQEEALHIISEYIDRISEDTEISAELLEQSKIDQKYILAKMEQIKHELDKITKLIG